MRLGVLLSLMALAVVFRAPAHAQEVEWKQLTSRAALEELLNNTRWQLGVEPNLTATSHYRPDGTATVKSWNTTFERTWQVHDDGRMCFTSVVEEGTKCFKH